MNYPFTPDEFDIIADYDYDREFWTSFVSGGDTILEIGCGSGRIASWFCSCAEYFGIDVEPAMVHRTRELLGLDEEHVSVGILEEKDWREKFDLIIAPNNVPAHVPGEELSVFLESAYRALKPEGTLILDTFNPQDDIFEEITGDEYPFKEFKDPADGRQVTVMCSETYDAESRVQSFYLRFMKQGSTFREYTLIQNMHTHEFILECGRKAGFSLKNVYGTYQFEIFKPTSLKQLVVLEKNSYSIRNSKY